MRTTDIHPDFGEREESSYDDRRREPRYVPQRKKHIYAVAQVRGEIRNESDGGACIALPPAVEIEIGQPLNIGYHDRVRPARVCWASVEPQRCVQLVGIAWETEDQVEPQTQASIEQ